MVPAMLARERAGVTFAAAITLLLLTAANASALTTVTVKGADIGDGVFAGTATCPPGTTVVSGGFDVEEQGYTPVNKAQGERKWVVQALETSFLTVSANCSKRLDPSVGSAAKRFGKDNEGVNTTVRAHCARGEVVAGGWRYEPAGQAANNSPVFKSNRKGSERWAVTAVLDSPDADSRIRAFAYCLRGLDLRVRTKNSDTVESNADGTGRARCGRGQELLGGGFTTTPQPDWNNMDGPDHFYFASHRAGPSRWAAAAHNHSDVAGRIKTTVICRT
jgi:hypothetical protein